MTDALSSEALDDPAGILAELVGQTITPARWPSIATTTWASPEPWPGMTAADAISSAGTPREPTKAWLPTATL